MVNNGRDKKTTPQRRKNKKKDKNNNADDDAAAMKDMDLPDDFSIFGGASSMGSSNMGFDDGGLYDDYNDDGGDGNDDDAGGDGGAEAIDRAEDAAMNRAARLADALSLASTLSSEKRSTKREGGYRVLFKAITQHAAGEGGQEVLESHWSSIWEACLSSIQGRGNAKPSEQYAACRVLEACSVVLGEDRDDVVETINGPLTKIVNATGRATQVRSAALRCLAMVHFICGTDCLEEGEDCGSVMDLCEKVGNENYRGEVVSPLLRATALDCWSLLSTTFHDGHIAAGDGFDDDTGLGRGLQLLPLLASCLDSSEAGLRRSAGECVSLIHECRLNLGLDGEEADNTTERRFRRGSWDGSEWEVLMDEVKQRIAELSVESSHHMSKQAKKQQRATFRDFMNTIVDDESPEEIVNWRGGKLTLNSWKEIIQLNFVRHCLQGGFQIQLMYNDTLHGVFGATFNASGTSLSQLEKRLFMSKTSEASKAADKAMTKQRRTRTNVKNHFLTADGEDI
mmetsp:Transcript_35281/g.65324  ORF Transcript_35281/g.65324 Transcript_35281/m.65324 type:complete len:510 (-) Transcript_35281:41-1570(-)|eukprot:CAMPEP_0196140128 /NCGR_PEP_ID=MMETSP0910-20130528/7150_1 /TAXON_ID=49265 /ORGANISM="Thalassiosira rotula, Strain GSO102" /LENGTH=509 /DNA_ID=CAMNT_0041400947 /DNA_START=150 /DNA_END=1679 /DNA_ORIENTATION=-